MACWDLARNLYPAESKVHSQLDRGCQSVCKGNGGLTHTHAPEGEGEATLFLPTSRLSPQQGSHPSPALQGRTRAFRKPREGRLGRGTGAGEATEPQTKWVPYQ